MVRCPTGRGTKCFYQRHAGSGVPEQLSEVTVPGFDEPYLYISDVSGLVAMVQMGVLEIHPWGVRVERPDKADRVIFDLDPCDYVLKTVAGKLKRRRKDPWAEMLTLRQRLPDLPRG